MEYSKDINALLDNQKSASVPVIDDPKSVITVSYIFLVSHFGFAWYEGWKFC